MRGQQRRQGRGQVAGAGGRSRWQEQVFDIRNARAEDIHAVSGIYDVTADVHARRTEPPWDELRQSGGLIVGELDGVIIGFGGIVLDAVEQLKWLYLLPQYQRAGWGSQILRRLEDIGWEAGLDSIRLHSVPEAVGFYRKHGYAEVDVSSRVGHDHPGVEMVKIRTKTKV